MRPGLDKPGALPLLVLILFSLLTLAPSLSNIYNLKFADLSYQVPLIKDGVADLPSQAHAVDHRKSWILAAQHRPRANRPSRSLRTGNVGAPTIPSEINPIENKSRLSSAAAESSFTFSRRARALRTYVVQQLDDYQFLTSFSNRTIPAATLNFFSTPASPIRSPLPTSIDDKRPIHVLPANDNETTSSYAPAEDDSELRYPLYHAWQQACRSASDFWTLTKESPCIYALRAWIKSCLRYAEGTAATTFGREKEISGSFDKNPSPSVETQISATSKNVGTVDAAGRHTSELRGSCMAVVIGLVVGIMWF